jgi:hypothetical protein
MRNKSLDIPVPSAIIFHRIASAKVENAKQVYLRRLALEDDRACHG